MVIEDENWLYLIEMPLGLKHAFGSIGAEQIYVQSDLDVGRSLFGCLIYGR